MRLAPLALLAVLAPACLSGLAEIRVQGADAGGADRPSPGDVVVDAAPRDAADDRAQLADVADAGAPPEAAVDAAPAVDLGVLELDVVDAGSPDAGEDRPAPADVQAEDASDAGAAADAPPGDAGDDGGTDAGSAEDCGVGFTACGRQCVFPFGDEHNCGACGVECGAGAICSRGVCGAPTRFVGLIRFDPAAYAREPDAVRRWDTLCVAAHGAQAHACSAYELIGSTATEGDRACMSASADGGVALIGIVLPEPFLQLRDGGVYARSALRCVGGVFRARTEVEGLDTAACCAPP